MTGALLFGRAIRLQVETVLLEARPPLQGLQIRFQVSKTLKKQPNNCEIQINNLAESTRKKLKSKGAFVELAAGYGTTVPLLFRGYTRFIDHTRVGAEWVTRIECGDGEIAYRFNKINQSFKPGTPMRDLLKSVVKSISADPGNFNDAIKDVNAISDGQALTGSSSRILSQLLKPFGMDWSIQNGAVQVNIAGKPANNVAKVLNADSGLIGSPEYGTDSVEGSPAKSKRVILKTRFLLDGTVLPGSKLSLDARFVKGFFKVTEVQHSGDTDSQEWYTETQSVPL